MSYEIKNISRYLMLCGLYPSKSKVVSKLDDDMLKLYDKQLISIKKIETVSTTSAGSKSKKSVEEDTNSIKECEVRDTDGRN